MHDESRLLIDIDGIIAIALDKQIMDLKFPGLADAVLKAAEQWAKKQG